MALVAARHGGIYETHTRDEGSKSFAALNEEIAIADRAHIAFPHQGDTTSRSARRRR